MSMNTELLVYFSKWFESNRQLLTECNAVVDLTVPSSETDKPGLYADVNFDNGELFGRVTLWNTGECDMEAISPYANLVFWENYVFASEDELDAKLHNFFLSLKKSSKTLQP